MILEIQNICNAKIPSENQFRTWITAALKFLDPDFIEVCIRIVDQEESTELNSKYRNKSGPTNILSFSADLPEGIMENTPLLGDLVICAPLVEQEAQIQNKSILLHWAHLTVHGILHLQGYDHERDDEATIMEALEIQILAELGFSNPYGEFETHAR